MSAKPEAKTNNVFSILGDTLESAAEAFEEARVSSTESAKRAAEITKRGLPNLLHNAAYGVSYGLVYAGVFVTELMPEDNLVRRGLREGAEAALDARKKAAVAKGPKRKGVIVKAARVTKAAKPRAKASRRARKVVEKRATDFDAASAAGAS
jgi:hypothetical protein